MNTPTTQKPAIKWRIVPEESNETSVVFISDGSMGGLKASTKWDGCTHLWFPLDNRFDVWHDQGLHYEHICDMDEFILYLQSMRDRARIYFGGGFDAPLSKRQCKDRIMELQRKEQVV